MKTADFLVEFLIKHGVTDVFGIPGGCVLEFLYALDRKKLNISAHLNYHEQSAGFAALGYAQVSGTLGVTYATKGPGITNLVTPVADAYAESVPLFVITAHEYVYNDTGLRFSHDQEIDVVALFSKITKHVVKIENIEDVIPKIEYAYNCAVTGRKGPVVLDFLSSLLKHELVDTNCEVSLCTNKNGNDTDECLKMLRTMLQMAKRPIFLIGDGINQNNLAKDMRDLAEKIKIPVISSRASEDIMADVDTYFGYVGSHGIRYANFIFSKADFIIVLGNRIGFPLESVSFTQALNGKKILRIDIDNGELARLIPNVINFNIDLCDFFAVMKTKPLKYEPHKKWLLECKKILDYLFECDINVPTQKIVKILNFIHQNCVLTSDVGNNEFWLSRAYVYAKNKNRLLYSKSFGALGCSIGKAIGAHYKSGSPVVCFTGDQGFQFNVQELEFIQRENLPIMIVVINNVSSGMIRSRETIAYDARYVHTTLKSGYSIPNIERIANAYGFKYYDYVRDDIKSVFYNIKEPCVIEVKIDERYDLEPFLPKGNSCQNMEPRISEKEYDILNAL